MADGSRRNAGCNLWLALAALFTVANFAYWAMFSINAYNTFHDYADLGTFAYDMYYHIHYPNIVWGLQYLVYGNHVAPDLILMVPLYAVFQSPLTLLFIQAAVLSVTGFVLFLVARDLLKDGRMALLLAFAYFLNPGIHGMLMFDFHAESLIVLFYILTFYFYMRKELRMMVVSLLFLLGSMEVAPFLALTLGLGLALYEMLHTKDRQIRKENMRFALIIIALSLVVLLAYNLIVARLTSEYAYSYTGLPLSARVLSINTGELNDLIGVLKGSRPLVNVAYGTQGQYIVISLAIVFLGFGVASLLDPLTSIVLTAPWLVEALVFGISWFTYTWNQYFGFALGGAIVATLLSMKRLMELRKLRAFFRAVFSGSIVVVVALLTVMAPLLIRSPNTNNVSQSFLFQVNSTQEKYYSELNYIISKIPANASLIGTILYDASPLRKKVF